MQYYLPSLIIWLPLLGFVFNAFSGLLIKDRILQKRVVSIVAPGVVLLAFVIALYVLVAQVSQASNSRLIVPLIPGMPSDAPWIQIGGFTVNFSLLLDPLSMLMALIVTGVGGLIHVYATGYMAEDAEQPRFFTYFNLFIVMMLLLVMGENFLLMFVGWEGVGTCSYLLIGFWYTDANNAKAGNKAFIVNRIGDVGFALGIMAVWSIFGTLSFYNDSQTGVMDLAAKHLYGVGHPLSGLSPIFGMSAITGVCILLFIGAMGKSAQIPLWTWLPDAMAGPTPVSALIHAATMVTAGVVMLTRCSWLFIQAPQALIFIGWIGLATAFIGATIAMVQNDIKRVLAYSTVSQLGYMFLACGVGNFTAAMFHVTTHAFFKALLFLGAGAVIHSMHGEQDMRKMGGLRKYLPQTWGVMLIGAAAISGFPFLSGFWSKDAILEADARSPFGNGLVLYGIGLFIAFLTAYYMSRLMMKTFSTDARWTDGQLVPQHHSNEDHAVTGIQGVGSHSAGGEASLPTTEHGSAGAAEVSHQSAHPGAGASIIASPPSMMIPLYILAVLAIFSGWLAVNGHHFTNFLSPSVATLEVGQLKEANELFSMTAGYVISSIVAIAGLALGYVLYNGRRKTGELSSDASKARNPIYRVLDNRWGFDWLYSLVFIRGGAILSNLLWRVVDIGIIDGIVNTTAGIVGAFSSVLRRIQTGYVRNYALIMLLGVVILLAGLILKYSQLLSL